LLSENFIREFQSELLWTDVTASQNLSDSFIIEFKDKIDWKVYFEHKNASFDIMKKFIFKTDFEYITEFNISHLNDSQIKEIEKLLKLKKIFQ
jgi:hypothetical protein